MDWYVTATRLRSKASHTRSRPPPGHEILRQGRRELELVRMTPDVLFNQMIAMGVARKLVFSYCGNPSVGSLHRSAMRRA